MVKKCCVYECKTNYGSEIKNRKSKKRNIENIKDSSNLFTTVSVFRFPKDHVERERWIKVNPTDNLVVHKDTVIL